MERTVKENLSPCSASSRCTSVPWPTPENTRRTDKDQAQNKHSKGTEYSPEILKTQWRAR